MHLCRWGEVVIVQLNAPVLDRSSFGLKRPNGQSLIRALRHIINFDSGLLIRHLDLGLRLDDDPGRMTGTLFLFAPSFG